MNVDYPFDYDSLTIHFNGHAPYHVTSYLPEVAYYIQCCYQLPLHYPRTIVVLMPDAAHCGPTSFMSLVMTHGLLLKMQCTALLQEQHCLVYFDNEWHTDL